MMYTRFLFVSLILATALHANADKINLKKDFDSLGGNEAIVMRAKAMDPDNQVKIVQNRTVDRTHRLEIGGNYGLVGGGDSYYTTQNVGLNMDFHINPRWSIGGRWYKSYNTLTSEGKAVYDYAAANPQFRIPSIDAPEQTALALISWYPLYGKLNLFDSGVSHFDIYLLGGYGKTFLESGVSDTIAAGGGIGFWITQYLAARLEGRYQTYEDRVSDKITTDTRRENTVVVMASIGILL